MASHEPGREAKEPGISPAIPEQIEEVPPASLSAWDIDSVPDLIERRPKRSPALVLAGAALLLALAAMLRLLAPNVFGQPGLVDPTAQITPSPAPPPTAQVAPQAVVSPLPDASPSPEDFAALLAQAESLTNRSEFEEAIALYQRLVDQAPDDARPEIGWARALLLDDEPDQALLHARQAVALDPVNADAMIALARTYTALGDPVRALGMAHNAVQLDDGSAEAHAALAEVYLLSGQLQVAMSEADLALALDANNPNAHRARAQLYQAADNDLAQAVRELKIAADLQPQLWVRPYELGLALLDAKDYESAIVALKTALGLRRKATTYTAVGEAYYGLGQYDRAQAFLQQALSAGAIDASTYALLAAIDAQQGRCEDARIFFEQALVLDATNRWAMEARATCQGASSAAIPPETQPAPSPPPTTPAPTSPSPVLGGWIAFPVWNLETSKYDTFVARPDGSDRHMVVAETHQPAFSSDGQWLAVNGERAEYLNLIIVKPDGSDLKEITEHIEDGLPCWSPDGMALAFSSTRHSDRQSRVYIIDEVPFDGKKAQGRSLNADSYEVLGEYPAWTASGQIVYSGCDYTSTPVECGLFAMSAEPGPQTPRLLTTQPEDTAPAASGDRIAFMSNSDGNWELYVVNSDGSGLKRLTENKAIDGLPTWSPDGHTLAFVSDQGDVWAVWAMNPDESNRRKLFDIGGGGLISDWQHERITWGP
jgi:TolB protein